MRSVLYEETCLNSKHLIVLLHTIVGFNHTSYSKSDYFMQSHYHLMHIENSRQIKYLKFHLEHIQAHHHLLVNKKKMLLVSALTH